MLIKKILFGYFFLSVLSGIGLAVWRTVLMVRYYDPYNNEFALQADVPLRSLGLAVAAVLLILATSAIFLTKFEFVGFSSSEHQFSVFTSALLGFVFLAIGIFVSFYFKRITGIYADRLYQLAQLLSYLLAFCCSVYFVLNATGNIRFENARKVLAFVPALWGVAFVISSYLDPAYNYNDFNHSLCLVAACALTLFFLYDGRMAATGKTNSSYFVMSLFSIVASAVYIIPNFVLLAYWELSSDINHIYEAALLGTIFYTCACTVNLCRTVKLREKTGKKSKSKISAQ